MTPQKKRKLDEVPDVSSLDIPEFINRIKNLGGKEVELTTVNEILRQLGINLTELKSLSVNHPSFSAGVWRDVATKFGLDPSQGIYQLDQFTLPQTTLPPSFHQEVIKASLKWLNVYQERETHEKEATTVRVLEPWLVHVCNLFIGRIVDKLESLVPGTNKTSGGKVEHEIWMAEGVLLFLIELKSCYKTLNDHYAQAILELHSAFSMNRKRDLDPTPAVYAILTDLEKFYFLRYDGFKFTLSKEIHVGSESKEVFLFGMIRVSERLFSILLQGYIDVLKAVEKRSKLRAEEGDTLQTSSAAVRKTTRNTKKLPATKRPLTDKWTQALAKALTAQDFLSSCKRTSVDDWERAGKKGLEFLSESYISVRYLDKVGRKEEWDPNVVPGVIEWACKDMDFVESLGGVF